MALRKALLFIAVLIPSSVFAGPIITNAPKSSGGGGGSLTTDNFNRADGDLDADTASGGGTWDDTCNGGCNVINVSGNQIVTNSNGDFNWYVISTLPTDANYSSQLDVTVGASGNVSLGVAVRATTTEAYFGYWGGGTWVIYKYASSTLTSIGSGCSTGNVPTTKQTIKLTASGSNLTLTANGTTVCTATDSAISATGQGGVCAIYATTGNTYDEFTLFDD